MYANCQKGFREIHQEKYQEHNLHFTDIQNTFYTLYILQLSLSIITNTLRDEHRYTY